MLLADFTPQQQVVAQCRGADEGLLRDDGYRGSALLSRPLHQRTTIQQQLRRRGRALPAEQIEQGGLAAARRADHAEKLTALDGKHQSIEGRTLRTLVVEGQLLELIVTTRYHGVVRVPTRGCLRCARVWLRRLAWPVQDLFQPASRHQRRLEDLQSLRDLDQGLADAPQPGDERVEHSQFRTAPQFAQPEHGDQRERDQHRHQVDGRTQQQPRHTHRAHARLILGDVEVVIALTEAFGLVACLQHTHAADRLGDSGILQGTQAAHLACSAPGEALIQPDHADGERHQRRRDHRQGAIHQGHRRQDADQQHHIADQCRQHPDIQLLERLGVVGHAGHQFTGSDIVEGR